MPRLVSSVPRYRKHKASGQAIVKLSGQTFYLGPHGTKASKLAYDRAVTEWLARGRCPAGGESLSIVELLAGYLKHAEQYYRKNERVTNEVATIKAAIKPLRELYGQQDACDFGPLKLKAVREAMIGKGWSRKTVNKQIGRIKRVFLWAVENELVGGEVGLALKAVRGLSAGRSEAHETDDVPPVPDDVIHTTLDHLPPVVVDMVRLQRLTGCRPGEVCNLRPCDVDTAGPVWSYRPESHKTEHHGRKRVVFIGPKGQAILRPYLLRDKSAPCFSPAEGERKRRDEAHAQRVTPLAHGNRPGTNRQAQPKRPPRARYTVGSYRKAIARACELAFEMPDELRKAPPEENPEQKAHRKAQASQWRETHVWHPNQIRHTLATEVRKRYGLEAPQVVLGHKSAEVTQIYAERDFEKAASIMLEVG